MVRIEKVATSDLNCLVQGSVRLPRSSSDWLLMVQSLVLSDFF